MPTPPALSRPPEDDDEPSAFERGRTRLLALADDLPFVPQRPYEQRWLQIGWRAALLALLVVLAFGNTLGDEWLWGESRVFADPALRSDRGLLSIWARPLAGVAAPAPRTLAWLESYVGGFGPSGVHGVNLLLHAVGVGFAWLAMRRLGVPGAWLAAAVAAVHPSLLATVGWPARQGDLLGVAAAAIALWAYLVARRIRPEPSDSDWTDPRYHDDDDSDVGPARWPWAVFGPAVFVGLTGGSAAIVLLAGVLLAVEWRQCQLTRIKGVLLGGLLILAVAARVALPHPAAAADTLRPGAPSSAFVEAVVAWPWSVSHAILPLDTPAMYDRWQWAGPWTWGALAIGVIVAAASVFVFRKAWPLVAAIVLYAAVHALTAGRPRGPAVATADLLPHAAIAMVAGAAVVGIIRVLRRRRGEAVLRWGVGVVLVGGLAWLSFSRAPSFARADAYWQHTLALNPDSVIAREELAARYVAEGFVEEAGLQFDRVPIDRRDAAWLTARARLFEARKQFAEAAACYENAHARRPDDRGTTVALAEALNNAGQSARAAALYDALLAGSPDADTLVNAGLTQMRLGKADAAITLYRRALAVDADSIPGHINLANALFASGQYAEAAEHLQKVIALDPRNFAAFTNAGVMLMKLGDAAKAERMFRAAVRLEPKSADAYAKLGVSLSAQKKNAEAEWCFGQARRLDAATR